MVRTKSFLEKFYVGLIFFLLYAPIAVLIVCSFNASKARTVWGGFTLDWYIQLFQNEEVIHAVQTSLLLTTSAALIATILGTLACIGMTVMSKRAQSAITTITNIPMLNADIVTGIALMLWFSRFTNLGNGYCNHAAVCPVYVTGVCFYADRPCDAGHSVCYPERYTEAAFHQ